DPAPIEDAVIFIESGMGMTWTVTTDVGGTYGIWFDEMVSPVTVTVSYEAGYEAQTFTGVAVVGGEVTTLDVDLRWLQPCVSTDAAVDVTLQMGTTGTYMLNLANNGALSTTYTLVEQDLGYTIAGSQAVADLFGYAVADSGDPLGPDYDFVDITAFGAPLALGDDDFAGPVPLGFDLDFYGNDYNEVYINSNGFLSFGSGSTDMSNDVLPNVQTPNNIIALMWDDLVGGTAYVYTFDMCPYASGQCTVVQYEGFTHMGGADAGTWQVILFRNGNILMQFEDAGDNAGAASTTGIENRYGTDGITYAANVPALEDELAVCFAYPGNSTDCVPSDVVWMDEDPVLGDILADDVTPVTLSFDASIPETSQPGVYMAALHLTTGDPYNGVQVIPVTMTVEAPATWAKIVGTVLAWDHCDTTSRVMPGATVLIESANGTDSWAFTTDAEGTYDLWLDEAHSPVVVTVSAEGYVTTVDVVAFDDGDTVNPVHDLRMDAPCFTMDTYAIEFAVTKGHTHTEQLMMTNQGAGMLEITDVAGDGWMTPGMTSGKINPGESYPLDVVFSAAGMSLGDHVGTLQIANNDPMMPMMTVPVTMTVLMPTVEVDVYATPPDVTHPGEVITYTIVVTNTSDGALDVDLTTAIPMHTAYIAGSQTGGLVYAQPPTGDAQMTWSGTLAPMVPQTFTFAVQVDAGVTGGTIDILTEVATEDAVYEDTESLTVTVVTPTIEVDVYATPPDVTHPGDVITYTIMVTNTGDDALAADLTAAIPMHTAYILGSQTGGLAYVDPPAGDAHMAWSGTLAPMAPQTFTFAVQVDAGVTGGTIDILAEVAVDDLVYDDTASVLVELYRIMLPIISKN
ncbi:MAG: DUF11 domain-containing protein, partial [Anaerolineae bacterium]|nr:DUF11 domain-containing protein [Anaerolineae bacterium]